jgi:hypothetical protein
MTDDALFQLAAWGFIAVGVACGIAWGRLSESLAMPELLRMLTTPLWTALLGAYSGVTRAAIPG